MQNYSDLYPTCQNLSIGDRDGYLIKQIPLFLIFESNPWKSDWLFKSISINYALHGAESKKKSGHVKLKSETNGSIMA